MDKNKIQELVENYLQSSEGNMKLASSMTAPLRAQRDHHSLLRKVFGLLQFPEQLKLKRARWYVIKS